MSDICEKRKFDKKIKYKLIFISNNIWYIYIYNGTRS